MSTRKVSTRKKPQTAKRYSYDDRKSIASAIENLRYKRDLTAVFQILSKDADLELTHNSNGVHFNLCLASDKTLRRLTRRLAEVEDIAEEYCTKSASHYN